jgi:hypothetical protein
MVASTFAASPVGLRLPVSQLLMVSRLVPEPSPFHPASRSTGAECLHVSQFVARDTGRRFNAVFDLDGFFE